jgi:hypothetical protein
MTNGCFISGIIWYFFIASDIREAGYEAEVGSPVFPFYFFYIAFTGLPLKPE